MKKSTISNWLAAIGLYSLCVWILPYAFAGATLAAKHHQRSGAHKMAMIFTVASLGLFIALNWHEIFLRQQSKK